MTTHKQLIINSLKEQFQSIPGEQYPSIPAALPGFLKNPNGGGI